MTKKDLKYLCDWKVSDKKSYAMYCTELCELLSSIPMGKVLRINQKYNNGTEKAWNVQRVSENFWNGVEIAEDNFLIPFTENSDDEFLFKVYNKNVVLCKVSFYDVPMDLYHKALEIFDRYNKKSPMFTSTVLKSLKKDLKALGFKRIFIISDGYGFIPTLYAYSDSNPNKSETSIEIGTLKDDNVHYLERNF